MDGKSVVYAPMELHSQERKIIERWRRMDPNRKMAFLALSRLLDATQSGVPMMAAANDAIAQFGGNQPDFESEHMDFIAHKAFIDAANTNEK